MLSIVERFYSRIRYYGRYQKTRKKRKNIEKGRITKKVYSKEIIWVVV